MLTTEEFIRRAREIHGDKYDYLETIYIHSHKKVTIYCKKHDCFEQTASDHLKGHGCNKCAKNVLRSSKEGFIKKAKEVHGDKYDYSLVDYINNRTNITIICPEHGEFLKTPCNHLKGQGHPASKGKRRVNTDIFIKDAMQVHGEKYNYSLVEYVNSKTKVCIICPNHGEFWQTPNNHIKGQGHPYSMVLKLRELHLSNTEEFIEKARKVHSDKYDYSDSVYKGVHEKIEIRCKDHGVFPQTAGNHLQGNGCPSCIHTVSKLEKDVLKYVESITDHEIIKGDRKLLGKRLELDILIPDIKLAIEVNGWYWHYMRENGNKNHVLKSKLCRDKGYTLFHLREELWLKDKNRMQKVIKTLIEKNGK